MKEPSLAMELLKDYKKKDKRLSIICLAEAVGIALLIMTIILK